MKGLLNKEPYYYKIHTSLKKSSAYPPPPSIDIPLYVIPPSVIFRKSQPPYK